MAYFGPFNETTSSVGNGKEFNQIRKRYRQRLPYIDNLPYVFDRCDKVPIPNVWGLISNGSFLTSSGMTTADPATLEKAYAEFRDKAVNFGPNLAVDIAEGRQTVTMIAKNAAQLLSFGRNLRALNFPAALHALGFETISSHTLRRTWQATVRREGIDRRVRLKRQAKSFADNYLQVHFGWEPLVKDIYQGLESLTTINYIDMPKHVVGKAITRNTVVHSAPTISKGTFGQTVGYPWFKVKLGGDVWVDNPNSLLLNQWGLVNPAVVLWELVPFSFVVDWFVNVGSVLQSYTDFVGLRIVNPYTTFMNCREHQTWYCDYADYIRPPLVTQGYRRFTNVYMARTQGLLKPSIALRQLKLPSVTRGLTAVSLLTQFLRAKSS